MDYLDTRNTIYIEIIFLIYYSMFQTNTRYRSFISYFDLGQSDTGAKAGESENPRESYVFLFGKRMCLTCFLFDTSAPIIELDYVRADERIFETKSSTTTLRF